jgi:hypothetical protein
LLAWNLKRQHNGGMKTGTRFSRLCGWSAQCATCALALAFCASAFATDPSKNVVARPKVIKVCYVKTIASGIPQRCDRLFGTFPTTANAMDVLGRQSEIEALRRDQ